MNTDHVSLGPWTTTLHHSSRLELSAFWRRRLDRLGSLATRRPPLNWRTGLTLCLLAGTVLFVPRLRLDASAKAEEQTALPTTAAGATQILNAVVAGFKHNYSLIKSFQAKVDIEIQTSFDVGKLNVDPPKNTQGDGKSGGSFFLPKAASVTYEVNIRGENERLEYTKGGNNLLFLLHNGEVTQYSPVDKFARVDKMTNAAGDQDDDPRNFGMHLARVRLQQIATDPQRYMAVAKIVKEGDKTIARIEAFLPEVKKKVVVDCDASLSYLPTRVYYENEDKTIDSVATIKYSKVVDDPDGAWFPMELVRKNGHPYHNTSLESTTWGQVVTTKVGDLKINQDIPDSVFEVKFADKTKVRDGVREKFYTVGDPEIPSAKKSP
jgi:hypothetical protein